MPLLVLVVLVAPVVLRLRTTWPVVHTSESERASQVRQASCSQRRPAGSQACGCRRRAGETKRAKEFGLAGLVVEFRFPSSSSSAATAAACYCALSSYFASPIFFSLKLRRHRRRRRRGHTIQSARTEEASSALREALALLGHSCSFGHSQPRTVVVAHPSSYRAAIASPASASAWVRD